MIQIMPTELMEKNSAPATLASGLRKAVSNPLVLAAVVFATALAVRLIFLSSLEHAFWYFEDSQNYLNGGRALLDAAVSGGSIKGLIANLVADARNFSGVYGAMMSKRLVDRLMFDGPIYTSYLAVLEWLAGLNAAAPDFQKIAPMLLTANAVLDALTCTLSSLVALVAFGALEGLSAGLLLAFYPGLIVNTGLCMSENFSAFLIALLTLVTVVCLKSRKRTKLQRLFLFVLLGLTAAIVLLAKPAFPLLIIVMAAVTVVAAGYLKWRKAITFSADLPLNLAVAAVVCGAALVPWLLYTNCVFHKYVLIVGRAPGFNILSGNLIVADGWTPFPHRIVFPADSGKAARIVAEQALQDPPGFIVLQLKKIARLWSSCWNDFRCTVLSVGTLPQTIYHQLLLVAAFLSLVLFISKRGAPYDAEGKIAAALVYSIIAFHFIYVCFISLDRYALPAMPSVAIAAALAIRLMSNGIPCERRNLAGLTIPLALTLISLLAIDHVKLLPPFLAAFLPESCLSWATVITLALAATATFILVTAAGKLALQGTSRPVEAKLLLLLAALIVFAAVTGGVLGDPEIRQWQVSLNSPEIAVAQEINLPAGALSRAGHCLLIVDLHSDRPLPVVAASINGHKVVDTPRLLSQYQSDNSDIISGLAMQAKLSDYDFRSFRHWWALPIDNSWLRDDQPNLVTVANAAADSPIQIYGDYVASRSQTHDADGEVYLPSVRWFSWNKCVASAELTTPPDPRIYERQKVVGKTTASSFNDGSGARSGDLSNAPGIQYGRYRIRLLMAKQAGTENPESTTSGAAAEPNNAPPGLEFATGTPLLINGGNPLTFVPAGTPLTIEKPLLAKRRYRFSCDLKSAKKRGTAFISLAFEGKQLSWTSVYQPSYIPTEAKWTPFSIADEVPEKLANEGEIKLSILLSPFQQDLIFTKRKKASTCFMAIKDARLEWSDSDGIAPSDLSDWQMY